jgi:DNA-directed RNA polymerase specialized sigma24 family protein
MTPTIQNHNKNALQYLQEAKQQLDLAQARIESGEMMTLEDIEELRRLSCQLTELRDHAITVYAQQGFSYAVIGRAFGIGESRVSQIVSHARRTAIH